MRIFESIKQTIKLELSRTSCLLILAITTVTCRSQPNLVMNGDFEEYSNCPNFVSTPDQTIKEIEKCIGWKTPTYATSDYYNACDTTEIVGVPNNMLGYQNAQSGEGYLGAHLAYYNESGVGTPTWWEYVQGHLISPLEKGKIYKISLEVSLAELSSCTINQIGVYFSEDPISDGTSAPFHVAPQCVFYDSNYFMDTINWMHLETYLKASGGEKYITIGNFRDEITTDTIHLDSDLFEDWTYFYIDNVVLNDVTVEFQGANIFTPNGDGVNDNFELQFYKDTKDKRIFIINRWGEVVYESDLTGFSWNGQTTDGKDCSEGTYFYRISDTNISDFFELIR